MTAAFALSGAVRADERSDDLAFVLARALYPVQVMAYCWAGVTPDPAFRDAADGWNERNAGLLANLEAMAAAAGLDDAARAEADRATFAEIEQAVAAPGDPAAYCHALARLVEEGRFDIDRRDDLEEALKRVFGRF